MMNRVELNEKELKSVAGGDSLKDMPEYNKIKEFYIQNGIQAAMTLGERKLHLNYLDVYAMVKMIAEEIKAEEPKGEFEGSTF